MMAAGGGSGAVLLIVGIIGSVKNRQVGKRRFGKAEWETYFGKVGEEPPLPKDIEAILNQPCPFSKNKKIKVKDTHMLVLIPKIVNGEELSLNTLGELIGDPKNRGNPTHYYSYSSDVEEMHGNTAVEQSHWVLMTRDVILGSKGKTYDAQKNLIPKQQGYSLPKAIEAAVCISMEYVSSGTKLYGINTYTRCVEQTYSQSPVYIGDFGLNGFQIQAYSSNYYFCGVAALRRFCENSEK